MLQDASGILYYGDWVWHLFTNFPLMHNVIITVVGALQPPLAKVKFAFKIFILLKK